MLDCRRLVERYPNAAPAAHSGHLDAWLQVLSEWRMPQAVLLAAVLRTAAPDEPPDLVARLGDAAPRVLALARACAALDHVPQRWPAADVDRRREQAVILRSLFVQAYADVEVALLVLAAHVARMRAIDLLDYDTARHLCSTNDAIFLPLTEMLGMWRLRYDLGDVSLARIDPRKAWDPIQLQLEAVAAQRAEHIANLVRMLSDALRAAGIDAEVRGHTPRPSGVYRHVRRGEHQPEVVRRLKLDVVVQSREACYHALACVHHTCPPLDWRSLQGSAFHDFIAAPTYNGYRILGTTVGYRPTAGDTRTVLRTDVRIFTPAMHRVNWHGVVGARYLGAPETIERAWWDDEERRSFVNARPPGSDSQQIAVFTPLGESYPLPAGSTPIDFAYRIHSDIGDHCKRIWVNGVLAGVDRPLGNGDLVEIETDPHLLAVERTWVDIAKTSMAKISIRRALRHRTPGVHPGRKRIDDVLVKELEAQGLPPAAPADVDRFLERLARDVGLADVGGLYEPIARPDMVRGARGLTPSHIAARWVTTQLAGYIVRADGHPLDVPVERIRLAQCPGHQRICCPTLASDIVGRLTLGGTPHAKLLVHHRDCPQAPRPPDAVPLAWRVAPQAEAVARITVEAFDRHRLLDDVLARVYERYADGLYLIRAQAEVDRNHMARVRLEASVTGPTALPALDEQLQAMRHASTIDTFRIEMLSEVEKLLIARRARAANPYTAIAVRDQRMFKGRHAEIARIDDMLHAGLRDRAGWSGQNLVVVYGINRIGKTSLLRFLRDSALASGDFATVLLDVQRLPSHREPALWGGLADAIRKAIDPARAAATGRATGPRRFKAQSEGDGFEDWFHQAVRSLGDRRLVIMIDELNVLDELWEPRECQRAVRRLKGLVEGHSNVRFVVCVQESYFRTLPQRDPTVDGSVALLRTGIAVGLGFLDTRASEQLIREPMGEALRFTDDLVGRITYLTSGHPYYIHTLMHDLVGRALHEKRRIITLDHLDAVVADSLRHGPHLFHDFLRHERGAARPALAALAHASGPEHRGVTLDAIARARRDRGLRPNTHAIEQALRALHDVGVVSRRELAGGATYALRVPLFADWLRTYRPLASQPDLEPR